MALIMQLVLNIKILRQESDLHSLSTSSSTAVLWAQELFLFSMPFTGGCIDKNFLLLNSIKSSLMNRGHGNVILILLKEEKRFKNGEI